MRSLEPENFPFCSEFYVVEKSIEVVVSIKGESTRVRIDALREASGRYSTREYFEALVKLEYAYPPDLTVEATTIWVPYGLPWTDGKSADEVLNRALGFLEERCSKKQ
jgi:hypothetical protein